MWLFLILTLSVVHGSLSQWNYTIYVSTTGNDTQSCLSDGSPQNACRTLKYAASGVANSTRVVLLPGVHDLNNTIFLTGYEDVAITGERNAEDQRIECARSVPGAGLYFARVKNLCVSNVTFVQCGSLLNASTWNTTVNPVVTNLFRSAMYVLNSTNVSLTYTYFSNGTGRGLVLYDTNGFVTITYSQFTSNVVPSEERRVYPGGGGLYIEHTYCTPGRTSDCDFDRNPYSNDSVYVIQNCTFTSNEAMVVNNTWQQLKGPNIKAFNKGGGLFVLLKGRSANNIFNISNCQFFSNTADFGGGLAMYLQDFASNNSLHVTNASLAGNEAHDGGGGIVAGYASVGCDCLFNNDISIQSSQFWQNTASWGGGLYFFANRANTAVSVTNTLTLSDSLWKFNAAITGSAIQLVPEAWDTLTDGYLLQPLIKDCMFQENILAEVGYGGSRSLVSGILFANTISVQFMSTNTFRSNFGTAIYANAGSINVLNNSVLILRENLGIHGGAIALIGFSALRSFPGANITFMDNIALDRGGAIYATSTDITDFMYTRSCFFRYFNTTEHPNNWNVTFNFVNNTAYQYGHSIYADTLLPCARAAFATDNNEVFHWTPFHYSNQSRDSNIATAPAQLFLDQNHTTDQEGIRFSPGEIFNVHPLGYDDLNNSVKSVYLAYVDSSRVQIDPSYTYVSSGNIKIRGEIGAMFNLTFNTLDLYPVASSVNLTVAHCPLGYVYNNNGPHSECICSASTNDRRFEGIAECDNFTGLLSRSYWGGCTKEGEFLTGSCPLGYCHYFRDNEPFVHLNRSCKEQDEFLCGSRGRTGLLCGSCKDGYTVFFHSQLYHCGKCSESDTRIGWFLYAVSELLPLVIIFIAIMVFNIRLTSGYINSFILFAQVLNFFQVNVFGTFTLSPGVEFLTQVHHFLFGLVNLSFFELDSLSFCLWERATALDVMVFKYVTTAFVLLLLLLLVLLLNYFTCDRCCKLSQRNSYVIHGISAFLIMSYAQCAKISFEILQWLPLMGEGPTPRKHVVFFNGNVEFFSSEHLPYAIPAIFVLLFFCTLPPLILIVYPVINKIPWLERLTYFRFGWLNKLKALIDSFQGDLKDNCRFFAGLFFLYRLAIAIEFAFTSSPTDFYIFLEVIIIIMLAFHALAHPYKKPAHNAVDVLIFADLAIINAINLYTYAWSDYQWNHKSEITTAATIQLVLIYLPIFYVAGVILVNVVPRQLIARLTKKLWRHNVNISTDEDHLPALRPLSPDGDEGTRQRIQESSVDYGAIAR